MDLWRFCFSSWSRWAKYGQVPIDRFTLGGEFPGPWVAYGDQEFCSEAGNHVQRHRVLAFGLVDCLNNLEDVDEIFRFAAGGFRDFTRIASSNPVMWRDICIANRDALGPMLAAFADEMKTLADSISAADADGLLAIFERAKAARDRYIDGLG